jgi:hypothetical protein
MLNENDSGVGREALVARCAQGGQTKNSLALPQGSIIIIDELGRPMKQLAVTVTINQHPPKTMTSDDYGRIYPLVAQDDEVKIDFDDAHESGDGDSIATNSGNHFERGGDAPRSA